jgi:hypothetical protein
MKPSAERMNLDDFLREFEGAIRYEFDFKQPLYSMVLGAGASRAAGIPLAFEMVAALKRLAKEQRIRVLKKRGESDLSAYFRLLWHGRRRSDNGEYASSPRDFILRCVRRAEREANLTNLLAAHLATAGLVNPIVTTNFDDLSLAGFWDLPYVGADDEPHVIYDPRGSVLSNPRVAERVPIIIKAHGHHTTYGLSYLDRQIRSAAPAVHQLLRQYARPAKGWIVVGYSGAWDDGIMRALSDKTLTRGATIFWLHHGKAPRHRLMKRVQSTARVVFVEIDDADTAFLRLWSAVPEDDGDGELSLAFSVGKILTIDLMFSQPRSYRPSYPKWEVSGMAWFDPTTTQRWGQPPEVSPKLAELRAQLLPILDLLDAVENRWLIDDCISGPNRILPKRNLYDFNSVLPAEMKKLQRLVPAEIEWTRRNRKLLRIALAKETDPFLATGILAALNTFAPERLTRN